MFAAAAVLMFVLAVVLRRVLPRVRPTAGDLRYGALLRSVGSLVLEEPVLRQRMVLGAVGMTCFTTLWTALAFLLSGPHYGYGPATIGLFGLAGLAGPGMAPISGRLADRGHGRLVAPAGFALLVFSWSSSLWEGHRCRRCWPASWHSTSRPSPRLPDSPGALSRSERGGSTGVDGSGYQSSEALVAPRHRRVQSLPDQPSPVRRGVRSMVQQVRSTSRCGD